MKKALLILGILGSVGCGGSNPKGDPKTYTTIGQGQIAINVVNQSNYSQAKLDEMINAVNVQLTKDVKPVWGIDAKLVANNNPAAGSATLTLLQDFSSIPKAWHYCTGFHKVGSVGFIDVNECENEMVLSVTLSHEALEMLSNPNGVKGGSEICDPVNSRYYGYVNEEYPTVYVSDFVYPNFYVQGSTGPYDKTGQVKGPLMVAPGGEIFSTVQGKSN